VKEETQYQQVGFLLYLSCS